MSHFSRFITPSLHLIALVLLVAGTASAWINFIIDVSLWSSELDEVSDSKLRTARAFNAISLAAAALSLIVFVAMLFVPPKTLIVKLSAFIVSAGGAACGIVCIVVSNSWKTGLGVDGVKFAVGFHLYCAGTAVLGLSALASILFLHRANKGSSGASSKEATPSA